MKICGLTGVYSGPEIRVCVWSLNTNILYFYQSNNSVNLLLGHIALLIRQFVHLLSVSISMIMLEYNRNLYNTAEN